MTIKVLEEKIGRKVSDIPHSNIFTNMSPRATDIKERINIWDYTKLKSFYKGHMDKIKGEGGDGGGRWVRLVWGGGMGRKGIQL